MQQLSLFSEFVADKVEKRATIAAVVVGAVPVVLPVQEMPEAPVFYSLSSFLDLAIRAHSNTSFTPDKRGKDLIKGHEQELNEDRAAIYAAAPNPEAAEERMSRYTEGYIKYFTAWLRAKSNCISSMITGPARFPVRRAEKANNAEHNRSVEFTDFRKKALSKAIRSFSAPITPLGELEQARINLAEREKQQKLMKEVNSIIRSKKNVESKLATYGLSAEKITDLLTPKFGNSTGYAGFELTNNNAQIKRLRQRVAELEAKQQASQKESSNAPILFELGEIHLNYTADRLQILFNEKPEEEMRKTLKSNGFKWSPTSEAWQRKLTPNALATAKYLFKVAI